MNKQLLALPLLLVPLLGWAADAGQVERAVAAIEQDVISWRRDFHQHPELGNREFRTAGIVASELEAMGLEVRTGVAHTGVIGIIRGGKPGPVIALRADMDALPVTEQTGLPYASKVTTRWGDEEVGVMHACGHDAHTAILLGASAVLSQMRETLPGTVVLVFQPAEEGTPEGENGGARMMLEEGVLNDPAPSAILALHTAPDPVGDITYTPGAAMASADSFRIKVRGSGGHGGTPWDTIDPVVVASQIVLSAQTLVSRRANLLNSPAVVTIGSINGGLAGNVIPDEVIMQGTLRTFDADIRLRLHAELRQMVRGIASAAGATAELALDPDRGYPVTVNDQALTAEMVAVLRGFMGDERVYTYPPITGSEDFAFFAREIPGFYFYLGIAPEDPEKVFANHSPHFTIDERALTLGVRAFVEMTLAYLGARQP